MITPSFNLTATERVLPKLALDFTTASLDSRITFTRALATATRVNSSGYVETVAADTPRFDYDPVTLACKGLLIEESRVNNLVGSQDLSNAGWLYSNSNKTLDVATSPDNTANADKLFATGTGGRVSQNFTFAATPYTLSVYAKPAGYDFVTLGWAGAGVFFNVANGTLGIVPGGYTATITPVGNGWYRCTATVTPTAGASTFRMYPASANGNISTFDGSSGVYIWGAQLEAGAFATSYVPTTLLPLTRNADVATMTGTNFSDWWQATRGGVLVRALPSTVSGTRPLVQFDDNTANEIIALRGNTTNPELYIVDGGTPQAQLDAGAIAANTPYSLTGWWDTNDCKARQNSGAVVIDTTATIPTVTQMRIGSDGTNYLNGTIATVNYYDSFLGQPIYTRRKNKVFPSLL